jgi:hypothetical protein
MFFTHPPLCRMRSTNARYVMHATVHFGRKITFYTFEASNGVRRRTLAVAVAWRCVFFDEPMAITPCPLGST